MLSTYCASAKVLYRDSSLGRIFRNMCAMGRFFASLSCVVKKKENKGHERGAYL